MNIGLITTAGAEDTEEAQRLEGYSNLCASSVSSVSLWCIAICLSS
jgi:hypothetical protein